MFAVFCGLGWDNTGFFAPACVLLAAGLAPSVACDPAVDGAFNAAGTGFLAAVDACEVAGFAAELAVFVAEEAGVLDAAGFFTGVFEGVLAAGFAVVFAAGAFAAGDFFGKSLSTILICCTPSALNDQQCARITRLLDCLLY